MVVAERPVEPAVDASACDPVTFATQELWPKLLDPTCTQCHRDGALAGRTRFLLGSDASSSMAALEWAATTESDGGTVLELKPTGQLAHAGGQRIDQDGLQHALLTQFVRHVRGQDCEPVPEAPAPFYDGVVFMEPSRLLRRWTVNLANRLPTEDEVARVERGGLPELEVVLHAIVDEPHFYSRVKEVFEEIWSTRSATEPTSPGDVLSVDRFSDRHWYLESGQARQVYRGLAYEPAELVQHVLANDRPFTEIVTGTYTVVNPFSARSYGVLDGMQFEDPLDPRVFTEVAIPGIEHAGVLSSAQYVRRHTSTDSNRNRHRALQVYKHFLGVDITALRPTLTDTAAATAAFSNPILQAPDCVLCHQLVDPLAGLFQWVDGEGSLQTPGVWYDDMLPPGFEGEFIAPEELPRSAPWLGERLAADPRFATAMTEHAWFVLTQQRLPTRPPTDLTSPLYPWRLLGFRAQRDLVNEGAELFRRSNFDFKRLIVHLAQSPMARAERVAGAVGEARAAELEVLGIHALLTPEQLTRRVELLLGYDIGAASTWLEPEDLLYDGLDFDGASERIGTPNALMGAKMRQWASEIACDVVAQELSDPQRGLFQGLDADVVAEGQIRDALSHLHTLLLNRLDGPDSPEVDRSWALFTALRDGGLARMAAGEEASTIHRSCRAGYPQDDDYVVRAWQGVLTYLLRRPEFLSQ